MITLGILLLLMLTMVLIFVMDLLVNHFQLQEVIVTWMDYKYNTGNLYSFVAIFISFLGGVIIDIRLKKKATKKQKG